MQEVDAKLHAQLASGVTALGLDLDQVKLKQMLRFVSELERWNQSYNLTSIRLAKDMVTRHLLDSLTLAPFIGSESVLDIGTGAGLPGVPLAVALPEARFVMVDSNGKKVRFVRHAIRTLRLGNAQALQSRAEELDLAACNAESGFDVVVARALASLSTLGQWCRNALATNGRLLAMKGPQAQSEMDQTPDGFKVVAVHPLSVPGLAAERQLIELEKTV